MSNELPIMGQQHYPRPRICPEPRCYPLYQAPPPTFLNDTADSTQTRDDPPGESWMCWGVMPQDVEFIYDGSHHRNDLRTCIFAPTKGLIAFQENHADWWLLQHGYEAARRRLRLFFPDRLPPETKKEET